MAGVFFRDSGCARRTDPGVGGGTAAEQTGRMLVGAGGGAGEVAPDAVRRLRRHEFDPGGDSGRGEARCAGRACRGGAALVRPADARGGQPRRDRPPRPLGVRPDPGRRRQPGRGGARRRGPPRRRRHARPGGQDASSRYATRRRSRGSPAGSGPVRTGGYLFATVHRAENRAPDAIRGWVGVLDAVARADRPVVLALHPGTRAAMDALGVAPSPNVVVVEPLGYRSSLAAQLHAAAVLTNSGGVQREAAWLGTPCLVLRASDRVGRDDGRRRRPPRCSSGWMPSRPRDALDRLAPPDRAPATTRGRARERTIETDGATASIARLLA